MLWFRSESTVPYTSNRDIREGRSCQRFQNVVVTRLKSLGGEARALAGVLTMPSLFRFLLFFGLLGGLAYGAVFSLATFVKYQPREIIVTIPPDKFLKNH
jgi:hypothetical protein